MKMKEFKKMILLLAILFMTLNMSCLFAEDNTGTMFGSDAFLSFDGGARAYFWTPGEINGLSFETEGLRSWGVRAALGFGEGKGKGELFQIAYEAPFNPTSEKQQEMISANEVINEGLEKYAFGINPDILIFSFFPNLAENYLLEVLFSTEFKYSRTSFYGNAKVSEPCFYLDKSAIVDWDNKTIAGGHKLNAGESVAFYTDFKEMEITMSFYRYRDHEVRAGYFSKSWKRPSDNNQAYAISTPSGVYPIIYDTIYKSKGFILAYRSVDNSSPEWNMD
ncbi:MAG: hypothetical protein KAI33_11320, partial [Elusimicrobiales bacterium]|nr:hypothetical protein [Elusimicrobiales bacterium]